MALTEGDAFYLVRPLGDGDFALLEGSEVIVEDVVEPGTPGVELSSEEVVIVKYTDDVAGVVRRLGFSASRFEELFTQGES